MADPLFPFAPLAHAMHRNESEAIHELGISGGMAARFRFDGMPSKSAEFYAEKAGFHPYEIWPELRDLVIAESLLVCASPECDVRFVPLSSRHAYCVDGCRVIAGAIRRRARYAADEDVRARRQEAARVYYAEARTAVRAQQARYRASRRSAQRQSSSTV